MRAQKKHITRLRDITAYCLFCVLAAAMLVAPHLNAADLDNDGLDDAWEAANGYSTLLYTHIVYVDAVNGDDVTGDGGTAATALKSLGAALAQSFTAGDENVILAAPGTYSGSANRELDFNGKDIWLRASAGASQTIVDLEEAGRFLSLSHGETVASRLEGFTVRNGYKASCGTAIHLSGASLSIRGCVFEGNRSGRKVEYDYGGWIETWWEDAFSTAAVYAYGAPVNITDTVFRDNTSTECEWGGMGMDTDNSGAVLLVDADGSRIERCSFLGNSGYGAGAIAVYGTDAVFRDCRFVNNVSLHDGGAISAQLFWDGWETMDGCSLVLENCLILGNKAFHDYSELATGTDCEAVLKHVTMTGGTAKNGHGVRFGEDASVFNSILDCALSLATGIELTAENCCSQDQLSPYGTGNLRGNPSLTSGGLLTSASFCRGAGGATGLVTPDIAGNTRNSSCIDLGCRVFADTDFDGIPDDIENAAGLNPANAQDASLDADSDGLSNLQEYLLGTDIAAGDSDGDGISDGAERTLGYNPAWPTRVIHVSPQGDDADDGLSLQTPKATFGAAVDISRRCAWENVVLAAPGTYSGAGNRGLDFEGYDIVIRGSGGAAATSVDLGGAGRFLSASGCETAASRIEGLTIRNGREYEGSAVSVSGASLSVKDCVFEECHSTGYGTIHAMSSATLAVTGCTFRGNTAQWGGAISASSSSIAVSGALMDANRAVQEGGGCHLYDSTAVFTSSRLTGNSSVNGGGAARLSGSSSLAMENCLLLRNKASAGAADLHCETSSQTVSLVNCTFSEGSSPNGQSCSLQGAADLLNSIFTGGMVFGETMPTASFNCVADDWSSYGSGNVAQPPLLTAGGMLQSGSPCIDHGGATSAPSSDLWGNLRPAGNGVDIGCHEFLDTDSDGIPDFLEGANGVLPGGDADSDGLTNLQEYLLGTSLSEADTDGDGLTDGAEVTQGYNPLRPTSFVHVSPSGSDANSGLSAATPKQTLAAAVAASQSNGLENIVLLAPGTYSGASNRGLDFGGYDVKLVSASGAPQTVIDLEGAGRFLSLSHGETLESRLQGLTIRNGYMASNGTAINLQNASLDIRDCVIEANRSGRLVTYDYGNGETETCWEDAYTTAALYAYGAPVRITGTTFRDNTSEEASWPGMEADNAGAVILCNSSGSVVDQCLFLGNRGYGAGAVSLSGASVEITRTRFLRNTATGNGGAVSGAVNWWDYSGDALPSSSAVIVNCLFLENRARLDCSDIHFDNGCPLSLAGCTLAGGHSRNGHTARFGGTTVVSNTILDGTAALADGISFTANANCTPNVWSAFGNGNIAADPALTGAGMLRAGSPCIDAGSSLHAPSSDLWGNARPAGNGVDIGCHEFLDTDSDGIPDFLEGANGVLPGGDADSDGLANLQEYLLGTDAFNSDTDGDGIPDGAEVSLDYSPLYATRIIHVSPSGSDANSGLSAATPKQTLAAAVAASQSNGLENIVLLAPGTYSGASNRGLDFGGYDVKLVSASGAPQTVIDLEGAGRFLSLSHGETLESRLQGLTIRNGYMASNGTAINLQNASLDIRDCAIEANRSGRLVTYTYGNGETETYWADALSTAAVYAYGAPVRITGTAFRDNTSEETDWPGMELDNAGAVILCNSSGSVIDRCQFLGNRGYGAGAVSLAGASAEITRTRFLRNTATGNGGAISCTVNWWDYGGDFPPPSSAVIANCLLMGNRAALDCSDIYFQDGCDAALLNDTILEGESRQGHSVRFGGDAIVSNTILLGTSTSADGILLSADCNCVAEDWSGHGTGNITADPALTGAGMLRAGSPCIDAGSSLHAPSSDLWGNARPAGNGVDIGCHEFLDTDSDGIPDFLEGAGGVLPGGDADSDGLANLQEYLLGTSLSEADTDGDGIPDGAEVSRGYSPLFPTRVIHVSPSGNDADSGLSPSVPKRTLSAAVAASMTSGHENIVLLAPGAYRGVRNRNLDFGGYDISLFSSGGASTATIDLAGGNSFLALHSSESSASRLAGLSFTGGREETPAISLQNAALTILECRFAGFEHTGIAEDYMFNDFEFPAASILSLNNARCRMVGSDIRGCSFTPECALVSANSSEFAMEGCRVLDNVTGCSPVFALQNASMRMTNTMVARNNTDAVGGVVRLHGASALQMVNCTFSGNCTGTATSIQGDGANGVTLLNTVFRERISGCAPSMSHCIVSPGFEDAQSGCLAADPQLAGGLFLTATSPCVDAGTASGAPSHDYAGTPRPCGAAVDIGCEEYRDLDGDGLTDFYAAWCGGGLTANGDLDGDGLSDLQEFQLGTDAASPDTDGDGMADGWEVAHGLDPLVNDADGDPDGDGLLNLEECLAGTDPNLADTDNDGRNDGWEVHTALSDPLAADFSGVETTVVSQTGNLFTDSSGGWEADGTGARARGRSGWLQYEVQIPGDGVYLLELSVSEAASASTPFFGVACRIDGAYTGAVMRIPLDANGAGSGACMTPFLRTGRHTLRFDWENVYRNTALRIDSFSLVALSGPDTDSDGIPDWTETRMAKMGVVALPETSLVSPVCIEGGDASYIEEIGISGYYVAPGGEDPHPAASRMAGNRWYADLPLNPDGITPVSVTVSFQNSAATVTRGIQWETLDTASLDEISVRKGDEMLLGATLPAGVANWTLAVGGDTFQMQRGDVRRHTFAAAGDVAVVASWTEAGVPFSNEGTVHVVSASFGGEQICHVGTERRWVIPGIGRDTPIEFDSGIQALDLGFENNARQLYLRSAVASQGYATARLCENGPVLDNTLIHVIETATHVGDGYHRVIADFGDGTVLYDGYVVAGQVVEGMSVTVTLWGANSTFEDGTQEKTFTWQSFDAAGELHFSILGGRSFTTCMTVILYQDGEEVWRLQ